MWDVNGKIIVNYVTLTISIIFGYSICSVNNINNIKTYSTTIEHEIQKVTNVAVLC